MTNQSITTDLDASERPVGLREEHTLKSSQSPASAGLIARAETYCPKEDGLSARLVAAEQVGSFLVEVPRATARQRRTLLTFAVEDRIAAPIQSVYDGKQASNSPATIRTSSLVYAFAAFQAHIRCRCGRLRPRVKD